MQLQINNEVLSAASKTLPFVVISASPADNKPNKVVLSLLGLLSLLSYDKNNNDIILHKKSGEYGPSDGIIIAQTIETTTQKLETAAEEATLTDTIRHADFS